MILTTEIKGPLILWLDASINWRFFCIFPAGAERALCEIIAYKNGLDRQRDKDLIEALDRVVEVVRTHLYHAFLGRSPERLSASQHFWPVINNKRSINQLNGIVNADSYHYAPH